MIMKPRLRKLALTVHITVSIGWIGAVIAYLAIAIAAAMTPEAQTLRAAWIAMGLIGWSVIVPLAFASLITGLIMSLGTSWGLFRHYWVLISLVLTILATAVLVGHMQSVSMFAALAAGADAGDVSTLRDGLSGEFVHGGLGLVVLLVVEVLNVYKPRGMTRYGWRKQQVQRAASQPGNSP
jgi:hypothetical protein